MVRTFSEKLPAGIFVIAELSAVTLYQRLFYFVFFRACGEEVGFIVDKNKLAAFCFHGAVDYALNHQPFARKGFFRLLVL